MSLQLFIFTYMLILGPSELSLIYDMDYPAIVHYQSVRCSFVAVCGCVSLLNQQIIIGASA